MFLMDRFGYAKTVEMATFDRNRDAIEAENKYIFKTTNLGRICVFTDKGQMHLIKVKDLPAAKMKDKGTPIDNISNYDSKVERFIYLCDLAELSGKKIFFGTALSMLKIVDGSEFVVGKKTTAATKLVDGDEVLCASMIEFTDTLVMRSKSDAFLRITCEQIPEKKKAAAGVRGMKLAKGETLTDIYVLKDGDNEMVEVKGKQIALNRLHIGNRDTKGVKK